MPFIQKWGKSQILLSVQIYGDAKHDAIWIPKYDLPTERNVVEFNKKDFKKIVGEI